MRSPSMKFAFGRRGGNTASEVLVPDIPADDGGLDALQTAGMATVPDARAKFYGVEDYSGGALATAAQANMATFLPGISAPRHAGPQQRGVRGAPPLDESPFGPRVWPAVVSPGAMRTAYSPDRGGPNGRPRLGNNILADMQRANGQDVPQKSKGGFLLALGLGLLALL